MGSNSKKSPKASSTAKARSQKRHRRVLQITVSKPKQNHDDDSIFDNMNDVQRMLAFSYYYDHPDELPDRESGAAWRAKEKPLNIRIKFDEGIFERWLCLRPIPVDELEEVDPCTPPGSPEGSISDAKELTRSSSPTEHWLDLSFP